MAKKHLNKSNNLPRDFFNSDEWEQIQTIYLAALLMDRTPAEILDAAYNGPEEQSVESYLGT